MKKMASLVALFIVLNIPFACNPCGPFDNRPYKIVSMSSNIGLMVENSFLEEPSTNFERAAIQTVIEETKRIGYNVPAANLWIINSAYACDPLPPDVQLLESLEIISSETVVSGGVEYLSGVQLNTLFKVNLSSRGVQCS